MAFLNVTTDHAGIWTATQALTWLAFGVSETWEEHIRWTSKFEVKWRAFPPANDLLQLLEARGGPQPFYPWHPRRAEDGEPLGGFESPFASPSRWIESQGYRSKLGAPELARARCIEAKRRLGRVVTFAELAASLRQDVSDHEVRTAKWSAANEHLRTAIAIEHVPAWAVVANDPRQQHVRLPAEVAFRRFQFRHDQIEPDNSASPEDFNAIMHGPRWTQIRFRSENIVALPTLGATIQPKATNTSRGRSYRAADAPLVQRGLEGIAVGTYAGAWDAALALSGDAVGAGQHDTKTKRLAAAIKAALTTRSDRTPSKPRKTE